MCRCTKYVKCGAHKAQFWAAVRCPRRDCGAYLGEASSLADSIDMNDMHRMNAHDELPVSFTLRDDRRGTR